MSHNNTDHDHDHDHSDDHTDTDDDGLDYEDAAPTRDHVEADLTPRESFRDKFGTTSEGTADPNDIRDDEIRQAVEEARERKRKRNRNSDQHEDAGRTDSGGAPRDATAADDDEALEPATADSPALEDAETDPDDFFADTVGDPKRDLKEAEQRGVHADAPRAEQDHDDATPDDTTMTDSNNTDDTTPRTHTTDDHTEQPPARGHEERAARGQSEQNAAPAQHDGDARGRQQDAARDAGDGGRGDAAASEESVTAAADAMAAKSDETGEAVEELDPDEIDADADDVADAMGGGASEGMPDVDSIDFDGQDIEGASESRGDELVSLNGCYFLLQDIEQDAAQNLLAAMENEALDPGDRFAAIIDTIVKEPSNAAARTDGWKFMHKAALAGRCMEHVGLDDIVDFQER